MCNNVIMCVQLRTATYLHMFVYPTVCTGMSCQVMKIVDEKKACNIVGWGDVVVTPSVVEQIPVPRLTAMMISSSSANLPTLPDKRPFVAIFTCWIGIAL